MSSKSTIKVEHKHHFPGNGLVNRMGSTAVVRVVKKRRVLTSVLTALALFAAYVIAVCVGAEGFEMTVPLLARPFIKGMSWLTPALPTAALLTFASFKIWDQVFRRVRGVVPWKADADSIVLGILAAMVLVSDLAMFGLGLASWNGWDGPSLSAGVVFGTLAYVSIMMFLAWMLVDSKLVVAACVLMCAALTGCEAPDVTAGVRDSQQVVTFLVDLSPSFVEKIENGSAFEFLLTVLEQMRRDTVGANARVIISRVSAGGSVVLLDTTPRGIRGKFGSKEDFKTWLLSHSGGDGSQVHSAMLASMEYMRTDPNVASGQAKTALISLSDMKSIYETTTADEVVRAVRKYQQPTFLYFVNGEALAERWRDLLAGTGVSFCVEADVVEKPPVPRFR
ncbi:MAG: hypothetical protein AB7O68_16730 [Pirellulales bacterium]